MFGLMCWQDYTEAQKSHIHNLSRLHHSEICNQHIQLTLSITLVCNQHLRTVFTSEPPGCDGGDLVLLPGHCFAPPNPSPTHTHTHTMSYTLPPSHTHTHTHTHPQNPTSTPQPLYTPTTMLSLPPSTTPPTHTHTHTHTPPH